MCWNEMKCWNGMKSCVGLEWSMYWNEMKYVLDWNEVCVGLK